MEEGVGVEYTLVLMYAGTGAQVSTSVFEKGRLVDLRKKVVSI